MSIKTDYHRYKMSAAEVLKYGSAGALIGIFVCYLCYSSIYSLPLAAVIAAVYVTAKKKKLKEERQKRLLYHFGNFISSLHNSMRSGYSLENGIAAAAKELEDMYGESDEMVLELRYMASRMRLSVPAEDLFADLGMRSGVSDIELFADLIAVAKRTGGNMGKLLNDTWRTICEKIDTKQEIDKQLSSVKFEQTIMSVMPGVIILYMRFSFGSFMNGLYGNITGAVIMTVCLLIYTGAFMLGKKLVRIEV